MDLTARLDTATGRVGEECRVVAAEREALDEFRDRVESVEPAAGPTLADGGARAGPGSAAAPVAGPGGAGGRDDLTAVREAFAEVVAPTVPDHVADGSLAATMRDELGPEVAGALAGGGPLTPPLRAALLESVAERRRELDTTEAALDREREQLTDARETVEAAVSWLREADETPLSDCGFDALRRRHERLASFRDRCGELARERQAFRRGTTGRDGCRVSHGPFFEYLYDDLPGRYPVLAAVAELAAVCEDCQRAVRAHLVRRA